MHQVLPMGKVSWHVFYLLSILTITQEVGTIITTILQIQKLGLRPILAKTWNQPKCPSMSDWTGKMWHIYTMEYYATIKNDEFVSFVGTWMNLETIILSKRTQEQKTKHHIFSLIDGCWTMRTHGLRERSITHWGQLEWGGWGEITWGEMTDMVWT